MKTYVELGLAALLAVLVYERPKFLVNTANTTLGIVIMIVIVGLLAKQYGINAGLLAAIIMILLQESHREGLSSINDKKTNSEKGILISDAVGGKKGASYASSKDCGPSEKTRKKAKDEFGRLKTRDDEHRSNRNYTIQEQLRNIPILMLVYNHHSSQLQALIKLDYRVC